MLSSILTDEWQLVTEEQAAQLRAYQEIVARNTIPLIQRGLLIPYDLRYGFAVTRDRMGAQFYASAYEYHATDLDRLCAWLAEQPGVEAVEDWSDLLNRGAYELGLRRDV